MMCEIPKYFYTCPECGLLQASMSEPCEDDKICTSCKEEMREGGSDE